MDGDIVAVTLGDPGGIGPEVVEKSLESLALKRPLLLIGPGGSWRGSTLPRVSRPEDIKAGGIYLLEDPERSRPHLEASFSCVAEAVQLALSGRVAGVVTGPISKDKWRRSGLSYRGHTDYLASVCDTRRVIMSFWSHDLRIVLFTHHTALAAVPQRIRRHSVADFIRTADRELRGLFQRRFRFYVSGFNPHCGEEGVMGDEESRAILPAMEDVGGDVDIAGLFPADVVYRLARQDDESVVLAWYHDQALIPFKLLNFHCGVNLTLGLPFVRTSPDHGTAFDISGKNRADPGSMEAAIRLADSILNLRRPPSS